MDPRSILSCAVMTVASHFGHQVKAAVLEICHSTKRPASSAHPASCEDSPSARLLARTLHLARTAVLTCSKRMKEGKQPCQGSESASLKVTRVDAASCMTRARSKYRGKPCASLAHRQLVLSAALQQPYPGACLLRWPRASVQLWQQPPILGTRSKLPCWKSATQPSARLLARTLHLARTAQAPGF